MKHITPRQEAVLKLFVTGMSVAKIAKKLKVSTGAIYSHLKSLVKSKWIGKNKKGYYVK